MIDASDFVRVCLVANCVSLMLSVAMISQACNCGLRFEIIRVKEVVGEKIKSQWKARKDNNHLFGNLRL